ncbi:MAG: Gfo/Idh/MocA family protein [Myxococcota bacterium]
MTATSRSQTTPTALVVEQAPRLPQRVRPIVCIGAGAIVEAAHAPAYRSSGFPIAALYDPDRTRARRVAESFDVPRVCETLREAVETAPSDAIFDLAVPAAAIAESLAGLRDGAPVLIQKPFGENLDHARRLLILCREKRLLAAVNFQLRYAPCMLAARALLEQGAIGELHDVEVRVTCHMPWQLWPFLFGIPRMEIVYHSIHYVDLVRSFLGEPTGVYCKTVKHPRQLELASTRTSIAFDYGELKRANIQTNHGHDFGVRHQESYVKLEGTQGAIKARLGVNLDYPRGLPDELEFCRRAQGEVPVWENVPLRGNWFPEAFVGTMASLMRAANGESSELATRVDDAFRTMAVVEACYASSERGATPIPD